MSTNTNTLEILCKTYPGIILLTLEQIAHALNITTPSLRNQICLKKIKLKTIKRGKRRVVHIEHFAEYVDGLAVKASGAKKIGRPRNIPSVDVGGAK